MAASHVNAAGAAGAARRDARAARRLRLADQAEGPVAAALHDGDDDVRRRHAVAGARAPDLPRRLPLGRRRRRVNHYWDRDIDARMARTADRPIPGGRVSPRAALRFGIMLAVLSVVAAGDDGQRARGRPLAVRLRRLRRRLHDLAQAAHAAEHRDRRRRRRGAAARRLGRRDRASQLDRGAALRDRLLLDAAALLGAQPADEEGVREGRRADDAGRPRRGARRAGRSCSTRSCSTR